MKSIGRKSCGKPGGAVAKRSVCTWLWGIEVIDRLVIKGDDAFLPLNKEEIDPEVPHVHAWRVWSRGDEDDDELNELIED
jgi:hypothetical protein